MPLQDPEIKELLGLIREFYFVGNKLDLMFFDPAENVSVFNRFFNNLYNKFRSTELNVYKRVLPPKKGRKLEVFEINGEIVDEEDFTDEMEGGVTFEEDEDLWDGYMNTDIFRENKRCKSISFPKIFSIIIISFYNF